MEFHRRHSFGVLTIATTLFSLAWSCPSVFCSPLDKTTADSTDETPGDPLPADEPLLPDASKKILQFLKVAAAYYFPTHQGYRTSGFAPVNYQRREYTAVEEDYPAIAADPAGARNDMGLPFSAEIKAYYTFQVTFPALRRSHFLLRDNCLKLKLQANLSPVSIEGGPYIEFIPIAFFVLEVGSKIGTGWDFGPVNVNGLAVNDKNFRYEKNQTRFKRSSGIVSNTRARARLQFDLAALVNSDNRDWLHLVFAVDETILYQYFSGAQSDEYWRWEHDIGENQNGFVWNQVLFLGYQMPTRPAYLDLTGILVETEQRITGKNASKMEDGGWGSDFISCEFGPLFSFQFTEVYRLTLLTQFKTARQYTPETVGYRYFEYRETNTQNPTYVYFYRVALILDAKF